MTGITIDLAGTGAIVTGAASGIGRATARRLAEAGAQVLACDLDEAVADVAKAIRDAGGKAQHMVMDAGKEEDVARAVAEAESSFGSLGIFHANAGITGGLRDLFETTPEVWAEVLRVNLIGPFLAIKHGAPAMKKRGGEPEEIADAVLWLSSPLASYVNGQAVPVCGGLTASHPYGPRPDPEKVAAAVSEMKAQKGH